MLRRPMLTLIKALHTVVWAVLAGCIVALPFFALRRRFDVAVILTIIILAEGCVLAMNHGRCPLTDVAARYTEDRRDSFDIYLPPWLARNNKTFFGTLFVINEFLVVWCWRKSDRRFKPRR
jgi:ABC-type uncharacterized transport system permease subunit